MNTIMPKASYDEAINTSKDEGVLLLNDGTKIYNPHTDRNKYNFLRYERAWAPDKAHPDIGAKIRYETSGYDQEIRFAPGMADLGCQSALEARAYAYHYRLGNDIAMHPKQYNFGHGIQYTPDLLCRAKIEGYGNKFLYYVEPHCVDNITEEFELIPSWEYHKSRRKIQGVIKTRTLWLTEATGLPVKILKPNHFFQIVQIDPITGKATLYEERDSCECLCKHCGAFTMAVNPTPDMTCPICGARDEFTILAFGDGSSPGNITTKDNPTGVEARFRDYFDTITRDKDGKLQYIFREGADWSMGFWAIMSECDVMEPVKYEGLRQLRTNIKAKDVEGTEQARRYINKYHPNG